MIAYPTAVIFDMDGLLVDTEPLQYAAFQQLLLSLSGEDLPEAEFHQMVGIHLVTNMRTIKERYHLAQSVNALLEQREALYGPILRQHAESALMPGARALISALANANIPLALASSSPLEHIDTVLDTTHLRPYFRVLASGQEVPNAKPDPAIYILALQRLSDALGTSVQPARCVALEDSGPGVLAAHRAGVRAIAVPNAFTRGHDVSVANAILPSLASPQAFSTITTSAPADG